ncbi:MAG: hypothetical protein J5787_08660 [Alphaproteobacteria bacterium]|nr:hypothetical protein [Alphaproteobacteria bacterium]
MNKIPIPPPTKEDMVVFQGLQRALVEKKAFIKVNFKKLNRFKSPFFNPWENVLPLLTILIISLLLMIFRNLVIGTTALLVMCFVYALCMPYFLEPFMQNRVTKRIVPRIEKFLIAWRYGGISIVLTADPKYFCQAPLGSWKQFTISYFSDLIPEELMPKEEEKNA